MTTSDPSRLRQARERFVAEWGALGNAWGINRSMASIHARLLVAHEPLSTDDLMEDLGLSRGNTSVNVRELISWGLVRSVNLKGERRQYYVAEKDPWRIFTTIVRERLRREVEPAIDTLSDVAELTEGLEGPEAEEFGRVVRQLHRFLVQFRNLGRRITSDDASILQRLARVLS